MYQHTSELRVRYGETDQMGYLYYGRYAEYYEVGRTNLIRSLGITYKSMEEDLGIFLPVVSVHMRYLRPAKYDDELQIFTELRQLPDEYIKFHTEIKNEFGKVVNAGEVKLAFYDFATKKVVSCPNELLEVLNAHF